MALEPRYTHCVLPSAIQEAYRGRRVLVTGARGFLGQYVTAALRQTEAALLTPNRHELDLLDQAAVRAFFDAQTPSVVIHLAAACGGIGANVANPGRFLYENALMGLILIESSRCGSVDKFVLVSTTCAYPQNAPLPLTESTLWDGPPTGATGPYGIAKRTLHAALQSYHEQYGLKSSVILPANLYGPGDHFDPENSHVVAALIRRYQEATASNAPQVVNWGTGSPTREFLHVRDAARGILTLGAKQSTPDPTNLGTGLETSIGSLAEMIARCSGYLGQTIWDSDKPDGQPRRVLNVERAKAFGFSAEIDLESGLQETIDWFASTAY